MGVEIWTWEVAPYAVSLSHWDSCGVGRGGMKFLIDNYQTQVGSTEECNPKELVPNRRDEISGDPIGGEREKTSIIYY